MYLKVRLKAHKNYTKKEQLLPRRVNMFSF